MIPWIRHNISQITEPRISVDVTRHKPTFVIRIRNNEIGLGQEAMCVYVVLGLDHSLCWNCTYAGTYYIDVIYYYTTKS